MRDVRGEKSLSKVAPFFPLHKVNCHWLIASLLMKPVQVDDKCKRGDCKFPAASESFLVRQFLGIFEENSYSVFRIFEEKPNFSFRIFEENSNLLLGETFVAPPDSLEISNSRKLVSPIPRWLKQNKRKMLFEVQCFVNKLTNQKGEENLFEISCALPANTVERRFH